MSNQIVRPPNGRFYLRATAFLLLLTVPIGCGGDEGDETTPERDVVARGSEAAERESTGGGDAAAPSGLGGALTPADLPYRHELYEIRDARAEYSGNTVRIELLFVSHQDIETDFYMSFRPGFMVDDRGQRHEPVRASIENTYMQFQPEVPEWIWVEFGGVNELPSHVNFAVPIRSARDHVGEEWFQMKGLEVSAHETEN